MMTDKSTKTYPFLTAHYDCCLPVWKQGDDLAHHLEDQEKEGGTAADAFEALAAQYEAAAAHCRRMVGVLREMPELKVDADTHHIGISGPVERLDALVKEGVLGRYEFEEDFGVEETFEGELLLDREGKGPFTVQEAMTRVAEIDPNLSELNPVWVQETLDRLVEDGFLCKTSGGAYEAAPREFED